MQSLSPKKIGLSCLGLLLTIGLGIWAARDLPRRLVAQVLADRLAARVEVDRFEVLGMDRFILRDVSLSSFRDYPFIQQLRLEELVVEGPLQAMLESRFERLILRGVQARLAPAPTVEPPDRPLPVIGELILEPASIRIAAGPEHDDFDLHLEMAVHDVGGRASGRTQLSATNLALQPLYELTGASAATPLETDVQDLEAELTFDRDRAKLLVRAASTSLASNDGLLEIRRPRISADRAGSVTVMKLASTNMVATLSGRFVTTSEPSAEATIRKTPDGRLDIELVPRLAGLGNGGLAATWEPADNSVRGLRGHLLGLDLTRLVPDSGLRATADIELRGIGDHLDYRLDISPTDLILGETRELRALEGAKIQIHGRIPLEPGSGPWRPGGPLEATFQIPSGRGRWDSWVVPSAVWPLSASFKGHWQGRDHWQDTVPPGSPWGVTGSYKLETATAGRLAADGEIAMHDGEASADLTWNWTEIDLAKLIGLLRKSDLSTPELELSGLGEARGRLRGPLRAGGPNLQGEIHLRQLEANGNIGSQAFHLSGGDSTTLLHWADSQTPIEMPRLELSGTFEAPGVEPLRLTLHASGQFNADLTRGRLEGTIRESGKGDRTGGALSDLGSTHLTASWRQRAGSPIELSGQLNFEALDLARWQRVAKPFARASALADYRLAGLFGAELEATLTGDVWHLAGPAHLESAGFASLDGSRVTEGLDSRWQIALRGAPSAPIEIEGRGHLGGFLLLWHTFFGDFSDVKASLGARARFQPSEFGPPQWQLELEGALSDGPIIEATLDSRGDGWRYIASFDDHDLATTHDRYLASLLEEQLGRLELGGRVAAQLRGSYHPAGEQPAEDQPRKGAPASWSIIGDVELRDLILASGGGQAAVLGLDLDLPLDLRRRPVTELDFSGPRLSGRLAFDRLAVRGLELPPTESDLAVEADSVGLEKPIALSILGGVVTFERLTLRKLLRSSRHLESGVELAGIRLERISDELGLIPLEGALNGHLTGVRLSPSLLSVDGGGDIDVFGGAVKIRDISGEDVLSRFPKLKLSADFHNLDLGAVTRRIDFGEMTGTLQGTLEDLELFRGVPVRFSAHLETVHYKGVPRTVDVKAINNITILGTGQRTSIFDRGIQRFFDRYTYERLGVTMHLDKDVLLLRGLEQRGDKELFLRGRLPFRIDVVNAQPGKTVSFQTMVGRLRSLDFADATTEP